MDKRTAKHYVPYIANIVSLVFALPWFVFFGVFTIPSVVVELTKPPPPMGLIDPSTIDYISNLLLVALIKIVPLAGIVLAAWKLCMQQTIGEPVENLVVSEILVFKSCLPLLGLIAAQFIYGRAYMPVIFTQAVHLGLYLASPLLAAVSLIISKRLLKGSPPA